MLKWTVSHKLSIFFCINLGMFVTVMSLFPGKETLKEKFSIPLSLKNLEQVKGVGNELLDKVGDILSKPIVIQPQFNPEQLKKFLHNALSASVSFFNSQETAPNTQAALQGFAKTIEQVSADPKTLQSMYRSGESFGRLATKKAEGFINEFGPTINTLSSDIIRSVFTFENAARVAFPVGLSFALAASGWYAAKLGWGLFEKQFLNKASSVINQEAYPKYGRVDRLKRWWSGYKTPPFIFDTSKVNDLEAIKNKTKSVHDRIIAGDQLASYTNLLLRGPSGTGKSLFARVLADYADMNFLPVTASSLLQFQGAFDEIISMANASSYGTIIFIDEVGSLFVERGMLLKSQSSHDLMHYKELDHILAVIGQRSNKFMIIAATDMPAQFEQAIDRRFPDKIEMQLPDLSFRIALLSLYVQVYFLNETSNSSLLISQSKQFFSDTFIKDLARRLDGFSPADIHNLIIAIRDFVGSASGDMINASTIKKMINKRIEDHAAFAAA